MRRSLSERSDLSAGCYRRCHRHPNARSAASCLRYRSSRCSDLRVNCLSALFGVVATARSRSNTTSARIFVAPADAQRRIHMPLAAYPSSAAQSRRAASNAAQLRVFALRALSATISAVLFTTPKGGRWVTRRYSILQGLPITIAERRPAKNLGIKTGRFQAPACKVRRASFGWLLAGELPIPRVHVPRTLVILSARPRPKTIRASGIWERDRHFVSTHSAACLPGARRIASIFVLVAPSQNLLEPRWYDGKGLSLQQRAGAA